MRNLLFILLIFVALSCENGNGLFSNLPRGVLSKSEMVDLLVDIHLAESALRVGNIQHVSVADSIYQKSQFAEVFKEHDVKPDDFQKSMKYYTERVSLLDEIYTSVIDRLTEMESELQGTEKKDDKDLKPDTAKNQVKTPPAVKVKNPAQ